MRRCPRERRATAARRRCSFWKENRHNPEARYTFKATDDIFALGADLYDVLTDPTPDTQREAAPARWRGAASVPVQGKPRGACRWS